MTKRLNLHDSLDRWSFDHAVLCTFTFDVEFFERYALEQLRAVAECETISVLVDQMTYDGLVSGPIDHWPRRANIRYLLHPIRAAKTFHPKLFLFGGRERGLLIIGSANFTEAGLTRNAELVGTYRFERGKREEHLSLFRDAFAYLRRVMARWPSRDLETNLDDLADSAPWLTTGEAQPCGLTLLDNLEEPLWGQMLRRVSAPVEDLHVLSRFYDATPGLLDHVLTTLAPKRTTLWTENGITTMTSAWACHAGLTSGKGGIRLCEYVDDGHRQSLHAKALAVVHGGGTSFFFGSANFTRAALLSTPAQGNVELLVALEPVTLNTAAIHKLLDPDGRASLLANPAELDTARREATVPAARCEIHLQDVSVEVDAVTCQCVSGSGRVPVIDTLILLHVDGGVRRLQLSEAAAGTYVGRLDAIAAQFCKAATTVAFVEGGLVGGARATSNRVIVINLQEAQTGRCQRRERRIREAQRNAALFSAVLAELVGIDDADVLKNFLTYCDIPMVESSWGSAVRAPRPTWSGDVEMRRCGEKNFRDYATLHDAAVGFCERHLRRLRRHAERPTLVGASNCMHIARAVAFVVRVQLERAIAGFESLERPMEPQEWYEHRSRFDSYLRLFKSVLEVLSAEYLPALRARFVDEQIKEVLTEDLEVLSQMIRSFLQLKARVDMCRGKSLWVIVPSREKKLPPYHETNTLHDARWAEWSTKVGDVGVEWARWVA